MAQKAAQKSAQKTEPQNQGSTEAAEKDSPLLDLSDQSVKKLIKAGKARGYVTHDELNAVLPSDETSPEQIEEVASVSQQSSASTEQVSAATEETAAATSQVSDSARRVSRTAQALAELAGRFHLPDRKDE